MNRRLACVLLTVALMIPGIASAVTEEDFKVDTTQNLINLCTASMDDPYYTAAVNFCHGYLVGAVHYHYAENAGPGGDLLVCIPDNPRPSREEVINMFIEWAKAHPEYMNEDPVETEFRFLIEKFPCKK